MVSINYIETIFMLGYNCKQDGTIFYWGAFKIAAVWVTPKGWLTQRQLGCNSSINV
jgi:hypothetical protein